MDIVYREAVASVFDAIQPEPGWGLQFFSGEAGRALVAESVGAALAVVGTREHVGIGRLVSGSVSHCCLSHAQCPVVAVPAVRDHAVVIIGAVRGLPNKEEREATEGGALPMSSDPARDGQSVRSVCR